MKLTTSEIFDSTPEKLWPLLFNSKMDKNQPCFLLCGLPKPVECRLKNSQGGIGQTRECVSDKGTITQLITEWDPNRKLSFEMKETNIYFGPCVESIHESFEIKKLSESRTSITRETNFKIVSPFRVVLSIPMMIGLKKYTLVCIQELEEISLG